MYFINVIKHIVKYSLTVRYGNSIIFVVPILMLMITCKNNFRSFFLVALLANISMVFSQVGINTTTPRKTLEVANDMKISDNLDIGTLDPLLDGDTSSFLIQDSGNSFKSLDVSNPTGVALAYIQEYYIVNPNLDWVKNFDTGIDSSDYVVIATSASFDRELDLSENGTGPEKNASLPYTSTFVENGTWRIKADYPQAANIDESEIGTWTITTLIFSSDVSKQFGTVVIPMSNTSIGTAITPIID
jgi:hypothetical protein